MVIKRIEWTAEDDAKLKELFNMGHKPSAVARIMERTVASVDSRRRKFGMRGNSTQELIPIPDDLREKARMLNISQLMQHYNRSRNVIIRWMREMHLNATPGVRRKAIPPNFVSSAKNLTRAELCRMYNTDPRTVRGWLDDLGLEPLTMQEKKLQNVPAITRSIVTNVEIPRREFNTKTKTIAAEAAQYLRKHFHNVFRADIQMYEQSSHTWGDVNKVPHRGINQYFVAGKGTLWLDELIALAERKGFTPKETI